MANEILSKGLTLSYSATSSGSFTALTNLISIPDLGATPEKVDVTNLADSSKRYINGIKDFGDLAFEFYYDKTQFTTLEALTTTTYFKVSIPDGVGGAAGTVASFSGVPSVALKGAGVGAAMTYSLSIALDSDITFA